jgi:hypothetical protein
MASFPKAIANWTNRINGVDIVFAADPNTLAAEIIATETSLGTVPNIEPKPPVGNPVTYANLGARVTAAMLGNNLPFVSLQTQGFNLAFQSNTLDHGQRVAFKTVSDVYGFYNGTDVTIRATGIYLVNNYVTWSFFTSGYVASYITINNVDERGDMWKWNFPQSGPSDASYVGRWGTTSSTWMGQLNVGDRLQTVVENGTPLNPYPVVNAQMTVQYLRTA